MYAIEQDAAHEKSQCTGIYVCDLSPGLADGDLWALFSQWGRITSFERVSQGADEALVVEYYGWEAARDARRALNYSCVRDSTVRCLLRTDIKAIRQSMLTGHRLVLDNLDPVLDSSGLFDASCLFGRVLDCKVEMRGGRSCGYGFAHYAALEEAARAQKALHGMRLGCSIAAVRPFEWADAQRFSGCRYSLHLNRELHTD
mmetsp:Transcript_135471/g.377309  ORF Transcript_135471/g.377309 Transcript_135471/m.377309 type:complete len:201 (-) Transcript_135471:451-1053(-)